MESLMDTADLISPQTIDRVVSLMERSKRIALFGMSPNSLLGEWAEDASGDSAKEAQELHPGDVINIPAGAKHWHGAAPDSWFSHLAVEVPGAETSNEWLEAVDDAAYGSLNAG